MKDRQLIYLSFVVIILVFIVLVSFIFLQFIRSGPVQPSPSALFPEKVPGSVEQLEPPAEGQTYQTTTREDQRELIKATAVGELLKSLPYQGRLFSLDYSYQNDYFELKYDVRNKAAAEDEFSAFLKTHGVEKEWLDHIEVNGEFPIEENDHNHGK